MSVWRTLPGGGWKFIRKAKGTELLRTSTDPYTREECSAQHPEVPVSLLEALSAQRALDESVLSADLKGHHR